MLNEINVGVKTARLSLTSNLVYSVAPIPKKGGTKQMPMAFINNKFTNPGPAKPCILWLSGGAWMGCPLTDDLPALMYFANRGYAVAAIQYRVSSEAKWPAQIEDVQTAVRYLRANAEAFNILPDHIGVMGASAGGHLALMTAMNLDEYDKREWSEFSSEVQCCVDLFGPTSLKDLKEDKKECPNPPMGPPPGIRPMPGSTPPPAPELGPDGKPFEPEEILIGGLMAEHLDVAANASPVNRISDKTCPIMIMHGDKDIAVPCNQGKRMYAALSEAGHETPFYILKDATHGDARFFQDEALEIMKQFFDQYLK